MLYRHCMLITRPSAILPKLSKFHHNAALPILIPKRNPNTTALCYINSQLAIILASFLPRVTPCVLSAFTRRTSGHWMGIFTADKFCSTETLLFLPLSFCHFLNGLWYKQGVIYDSLLFMPRKKKYVYTRWFKYDRDKLWLVYTQTVPVTFEPPCNFKLC
jgi:hypothetical protein